MQIAKALIGGLIGGGVGAYLAQVLQSMFAGPMTWALLLAGLGAGLGVRLLCSSDRNYVTGGVAALATIVALLGTSYASSLAVLKTAEDSPPPVVVFEMEDVGEEQDASEDSDDVAEEAEADSDMAALEDESDTETADDDDADDDDADDDDADDDDADDEDADDEEVEAAETVPGHLALEQPPRPAATKKDPGQVDWSSWEVILHAASALLAYVLGTGAAAASVVAGGAGSGTPKDQADAENKA